MAKYEYLVKYWTGRLRKDIQEGLNELGADGWKVVAIGPSSVYILMREK